jgi:protein-S-isoprenylcysteine O-methyltransferase Ste14
MTGFDRFLEAAFYPVAWGTLALAPVVLLALLFVNAPYGRHLRRGWGPVLDNRLGWFLMEMPAVAIFGGVWLAYAGPGMASLALFLLWQVHYCHRVFIYPWTLQQGKKMPWLILLMAVVFNTSNGFLNGWSIASQPERYQADWLLTPQFMLGVLLFFAGMALNKASDRQLARLRNAGEGYQIPHGLGYRWVSCPNYLGEIIQWIGWAVATWSLAGWIFAIWTMANLVPRAIAHHRWYRATFAGYPPGRRALIPHLL